MKSYTRHPHWIWLYLIVPLVLVLGWFEVRLQISPTWHRVVEIGILVLVYGFVNIWLSLNESALYESASPNQAPAKNGQPKQAHRALIQDPSIVADSARVDPVARSEVRSISAVPDRDVETSEWEEIGLEWVAWGDPAPIEHSEVGRDE